MIFLHKIKQEGGFALITAIMLLFAATVLGLMVMNSSEMEILLSGAVQRYEQKFSVAEGAANIEAATAIKKYNVLPEQGENQILSPRKSHDPNFDPGNDMTADDEGTEYEISFDPDPAALNDPLKNTPPYLWPTQNLLASNDSTNNPFDYHYRTIFRLRKRIEEKAYSAESSEQGRAIYSSFWQTNAFNDVKIEAGFVIRAN